MPRPRSRPLALAAAVAALAIALSGCSADAKPSPSPTPSSGEAAPIFASDEEALAAAVAAYEAYAEASRKIAADGGTATDRIDKFITDEFAPTVKEEFAALRSIGGRLEGSSTYDTVSLVERVETAQVASVSIYLCRDVSNVRAIISDGTDVTPEGRLDRVPTVADFVSGSDASLLLVNGVRQWSGENFC